MTYGTLLSLDTLATLNNTLVIDIGEDRIFQAIQDALTIHNDLLTEKLSTLVEDTTDLFRRFGGVDQMEMEEISELGVPDAEKVTAGATLGFPMRRHGKAVQWSRLYFQNATGAELAVQFTAVRDSSVRRLDREIRRALFGATNYTFKDRLTNWIDIPVKRLLNADGVVIPLDPSGNTFNGATHTHYLATAALTAADLVALIETVIEHFATGTAVVYINRAQETAVRALTGFVAYTDARIVPASTATTARSSLATNLLYNRAIGIFTSGGVTAEVWVKPWIPASYVFCFLQGQPKPLVRRTRRPGSGGLQLEYEDEAYPLRARVFVMEFGLGVGERRNGAVLFTGGGAYVAPTIT